MQSSPPDSRAGGAMCPASHVLWKFRGARHTLHQVPIVRPVRPVRQVRHSLLPPCALRNVLCQPTEHTAMCFGNFGEHGSHCTKCPSSVQVRTSPYKSVFPCPHPVHCAMCSASRRECALFSGERHAHGARGETSLFPVSPSPLSPVCCIEACGTLCGFFKLEALAPFPAPAGSGAA